MASTRLDRTEIGIVRRFGHVRLPHAAPGVHYKLPWPIDRLTRIQAAQVRVVEIGFRSQVVHPRSEPATYEWNAEHRSGRFVRKPEESLMLAGDQNMIELNAAVHYDLARPEAFVLSQADGAATVRAAFESVVQRLSRVRDGRTPHHGAGSSRRSQAQATFRMNWIITPAVSSVLGSSWRTSILRLEVVRAFRDVSGA